MSQNEHSIVLTGASSFSGSAIAQELAERGCNVIAPIPGSPNSYDGIRGRRVKAISKIAEVVFEASVGSANFLHAVRSQKQIEAVCLHHAVVGDYRSHSFDVGMAISDSVLGARFTSELLAEAGCRVAILTRSVFEEMQGLTDDPRPIGLYAISKTATANIWSSHLTDFGISTSNYTITNPIGVNEEPRLVAYLVSKWKLGQVAELRSPHLIRDNIPIELLAADYCDHLMSALTGASVDRNPSFWVGSNRDFAERVSSEFAMRSGTECKVAEADPPDQSEPRIRIGQNLVIPIDTWSVESFWDEYFDYYSF